MPRSLCHCKCYTRQLQRRVVFGSCRRWLLLESSLQPSEGEGQMLFVGAGPQGDVLTNLGSRLPLKSLTSFTQ